MTTRLTRSICALGIVALACTAAMAARRQLFDGAAYIHSLEKITVVYPAAADQDIKTNRASADLRAAYLRERFDVDATIVADDAVTPEQLQGNLLVLGWDNRLLGTEEVSRPFARDGDALLFLGQSVGRSTDDLLMLHNSPFNPSSVIVFWSRIDPELDRFSAFPFVGADWVVYRRYTPVWLGMFRDSAAWPPARNPATEHYTEPFRPPVSGESEHYLLHDGDRLSAEERVAVLEAREAAFALAAERIGDPGEGFKIHVFVYEDREAKEELIGVPDAVHSVPRDRELHLPKAQALVANPHEEYHLIADVLLGPCTLTAMYEGLSVSHEGRPGLDDLGVYAAMMDEADSFPSLESLFDDERMRKMALGGGAFQSAALLVQWIQEVGGRELLAEAYSISRGGAVEELAAAMGLEPEELEPTFHAWLSRRAAGARSELDYHRAMDDAATAARAGESETYLAALRLALQSLPNDPDALYQIGVEEKKRGRPEESRKVFSKVSTLDVRPDQLHFVIFSHFQLGQLAESAGEIEAARRSYQRMLDMPDRHDSHRMARESMAELPDRRSD